MHEKLVECCFPNNLTPGDPVGAISYVSSREEHVSGDFEALNIRTIGIKNMDVQPVMDGRAIPIEVYYIIIIFIIVTVYILSTLLYHI